MQIVKFKKVDKGIHVRSEDNGLRAKGSIYGRKKSTRLFEKKIDNYKGLKKCRTKENLENMSWQSGTEKVTYKGKFKPYLILRLIQKLG